MLHEVYKSSYPKNYLLARNHKEQTSLLIASTVGSISVLKALLDEGSDPLSSDIIGCTIFLNLARGAHLWALHYVYGYILEHLGGETVNQLLNARDHDNHGVLDWAAEAGNH